MSAGWILAREALADAVRRRIALAVAAFALLSLLAVNSCTSCASGQVEVNGQLQHIEEVAGAAGIVTLCVLGLWMIALAGMLASDHLQQTLEDGSAALSLARPVGRPTFALARLAGALGVAGAALVTLFGITTALLVQRGSLAPGPALLAALGCAVSTACVGALAMTLSLWLPRIACILVVAAGIGAMALANGFEALKGASGGVLGALDALGPPLLSTLLLPLAPWVPQLTVHADPTWVALRALVWLVASLALLVRAFSRVELGR